MLCDEPTLNPEDIHDSFGHGPEIRRACVHPNQVVFCTYATEIDFDSWRAGEKAAQRLFEDFTSIANHRIVVYVTLRQVLVCCLEILVANHFLIKGHDECFVTCVVIRRTLL